jgi:hypothetical protein
MSLLLAKTKSAKYFKIVSALYRGHESEMVKRELLISNVCAGNLTLCRSQHSARELRVRYELRVR